MKTILDELKEMQTSLNKLLEEIRSIDEKIKSLVEHREQLQIEADLLQDKISISIKWAAYHEEKAREKLLYDAEALATLYASQRTLGDFRTFCEQTSIDLPQAFSEAIDP